MARWFLLAPLRLLAGASRPSADRPRYKPPRVRHVEGSGRARRRARGTMGVVALVARVNNSGGEAVMRRSRRRRCSRGRPIHGNNVVNECNRERTTTNRSWRAASCRPEPERRWCRAPAGVAMQPAVSLPRLGAVVPQQLAPPQPPPPQQPPPAPRADCERAHGPRSGRRCRDAQRSRRRDRAARAGARPRRRRDRARRGREDRGGRDLRQRRPRPGHHAAAARCGSSARSRCTTR